MIPKGFFARAAGALVLAFLIASTALYWLPSVQRLVGWSTGWYVYDYYDTYTPDYGSTYVAAYDSTFTPAADALKAAAAETERSAMNDIHNELEKETIADLNRAKAFPDVCTTALVDCRGLPDAKVRPFFDAVLADRQYGMAQGANLISFGSAVIAVLALALGIFNASRKRTAV